MSDIYVKDTERAMSGFVDRFECIESYLSKDFKESYTAFINEVEGIIGQYKEKLEKIEELEEKIEEING